MLPRRTVMFAAFSLAVAGASIACGLSTIGTGDPFYGSADSSTDHTTADGEDPNGDDGSVFVTPDGSGPTILEAGADAEASTDAGSKLDAADGAPVCTSACTTAGGTCMNNVCTIDCSNSNVGACAAPNCPPGHVCFIKCGGGDCTGPVSCVNSIACDVQCSGGGSCTGGIKCAGKGCGIQCMGGGSCTGEIVCTADRCNIACTQGGACTKDITCASATSCSVTCANGAVCPSLDVAAPDAAVSCGMMTGGDDCHNVSCYADGGLCRIGCSGNDCQGDICCSGKCTGTNNGNGADTCP